MALPADPAALAATTGNAVIAAARAVWTFLKVACNLNAELKRMADEWETTRPEQAARLREVALRGWDWQ